jgi:large subunit ribosomal protein L24
MQKTTQPRKQRKRRALAPMHIRKKLMCANVAKELRAALGGRSSTVHKGDRVKVLVGRKKGHTGKVIRCDYNDLKVYIEGLSARNAKGTEKLIPVAPCNVQIIEREKQ